MSKENFYPGFWNGEQAAFRIVKCIVGPEPKHLTDHFEKHSKSMPEGKRKRFLWFEAFEGQEWEVVEVHYGPGEPFFLDNFDGSGFYKVVAGKGSPQVGHRSIYPTIIISEVTKENWTRPDSKLTQITDRAVDEYFTTKDPEGYAIHKKEIEALRKTIQRLHEDPVGTTQQMFNKK